MNILVTGAAGFIGYHLCKKLILSKNFIYGIDSFNDYYDVELKKNRIKDIKNLFTKKDNFKFSKINLLNKKKLKEIFIRYKFKKVIHLAAQAGVRNSIENPHEYIDNNITAYVNLIEISKNFNVKHFVYASTSSVYAKGNSIPFQESQNVDHPIQLYAATKRSNELIAHVYSHLFNLPTTGLRFFTVYGPWGRPDMALFIFTKNIINKEPIEVFNYGNHIRDFTYVEDIVNGIIKASKKIPKKNNISKHNFSDPSKSYAPFRIYNVGKSKDITLKKFIKEIEINLKQKAKIKYLPIQKGDTVATISDISNLIKDVDYNPQTSVEIGIKKFIIWYRKYYNV